MNRTRGILAFALGVFLMPGDHARAASYFENFPTGSHADPATNYGFSQLAGSGSHVRSGMQIDPGGLALFGGGAWAAWSVVGIDTGVTAVPNKLTVFSADVSACPPADGQDGTSCTSHWGFFNVNNSVAWGGIGWSVTDADAGAAQHGWLFNANHVSPGVGDFYVPGYLGTRDAQNGQQELIVRLEIFVDRLNNLVWGTIDDGVTKTTTPTVLITQNADMNAVITGGLTANTGWQTAEGIDVDNIQAISVISQEIMDIVVEDTDGMEFQSQPGETYRLEYALPPNTKAWIDTGVVLTGDGNLMTFFDSTEASASKIYRVVRSL